MSELVQAILRFLRNFKLWVMVSPWEQAIRVRMGKRVFLLGAGPHLRLPLIDVIYVQTTRLRFTQTDRQTVTTRNGVTVSFACSIGYEIRDLEKLYRTLHHAEDTIRQIVRGAAAGFIMQQYRISEVKSYAIEEAILGECELDNFGLKTIQVLLTDFAIARTYRLIGDYAGAYAHGSALDTESKEGKAT